MYKYTQKHRKLHNIHTKQPQFTQNTSKNTYILQISHKTTQKLQIHRKETHRNYEIHTTSPIYIYIYIHIHIHQNKKFKPNHHSKKTYNQPHRFKKILNAHR